MMLLFELDLARLVDVVRDDRFPAFSDGLVQIHRRHGVLDWAVRSSGELDIAMQLFRSQVLELARARQPVASPGLHERLVLGGIPYQEPRMEDTERRQVVLEGVSDQNASGENVQHLGTAGVQIDRALFQMLRRNPADERPVVRDGTGRLDVLIQKDAAIPPDDRHAGQRRLLSVRPHADHFAIHRDVPVEILMFLRRTTPLLLAVVLVAAAVLVVVLATIILTAAVVTATVVVSRLGTLPVVVLRRRLVGRGQRRVGRRRSDAGGVVRNDDAAVDGLPPVVVVASALLGNAGGRRREGRCWDRHLFVCIEVKLCETFLFGSSHSEPTKHGFGQRSAVASCSVGTRPASSRVIINR